MVSVEGKEECESAARSDDYQQTELKGWIWRRESEMVGNNS